MADSGLVPTESSPIDVTEDELARLAGHTNICNLDQVAVEFLGLTNNEVSACRHNAKLNSSDNYAWTSIFYCLLQWRKMTTEANPRRSLHTQLNKAAEKGLLSKADINFLKDKPTSQIAREFHGLNIDSTPSMANDHRKQSVTLVENDLGESVQRRLQAAHHVSTVDCSKTTTYKVSVRTSDIPFAGTEAKVFLKLIGNGDHCSEEIQLVDKKKDKFKRDKTAVFVLEDLPSVGDLTAVKVRHNDSGSLSDWHLQHIQVEETTSGKVYNFPCDNWIGKDYKISRTLPRTESISDGDEIDYKITVTTSDVTSAGMVQNVCIAFDEKNIDKSIILECDPDLGQFNRGQKATFSIMLKDLGHLKTCYVGAVKDIHRHLPVRGAYDDKWHCQKVSVMNTLTQEKYRFNCGEWLTITNSISPDSVKKLQCKTVNYEVAMVTGGTLGAGTDANVFVTLIGTNGNSGKRPLKKKRVNLFEMNQTDVFLLALDDLGDLSQLTVEHDGRLFGADWFLDRAEVKDMSRDRKWIFPCDAWLKKKDGTNKRTLVSRN